MADVVNGAATMRATILAVAPDLFRGKNGEQDTIMFRLYMQDARGRVGFVYSRREYKPGDVVTLGLAEREGRLKLAVLA